MDFLLAGGLTLVLLLWPCGWLLWLRCVWSLHWCWAFDGCPTLMPQQDWIQPPSVKHTQVGVHSHTHTQLTMQHHQTSYLNWRCCLFISSTDICHFSDILHPAFNTLWGGTVAVTLKPHKYYILLSSYVFYSCWRLVFPWDQLIQVLDSQEMQESHIFAVK